MSLTQRALPVLILTIVVLVIFFHSLDNRESWRRIPQTVGLGEVLPDLISAEGGSQSSSSPQDPATYDSKLAFFPGSPKPPGSNYSRIVVIPRMTEEDVEWTRELEDMEFAVYVADDPTASLHPPKNKGHEVMIYLTYIIGHYDQLPDVVIFLHSHRWSWHNNDLLGYDASHMIAKLSAERVTREGYMNLRCHWDPGCPDWLHPGNTVHDIYKLEETLLAKSWSELFPLDPIPNVLAQPCCAQFAVSRERVLAIPLERFVFYRDWLLNTPLSDYISGRIWEYTWQYVFTGHNTYCRSQHACYCDGYGVCLGGEKEYNDYFELRYKKTGFESELREWEEKENAIAKAEEEGLLDEAADLDAPEIGRDVYLKDQIQALNSELDARLFIAEERGKDPKIRAEESGRDWKPGDGF